MSFLKMLECGAASPSADSRLTSATEPLEGWREWGSVFDLLHPDAAAGALTVVGSGRVPQGVENPRGAVEAVQPHPGLLLMVPDERERRDEGWLAANTSLVLHHVRAGGTAYVLMPPRPRWFVMRRLARAGARVDAFLHARSGTATEYWIPCHGTAAAYVMATVPHHRSAAWQPLLRYAAPGALAARVCPSVGCLVRGEHARPLLAWTSALWPELGPQPSAVVRTKRLGNAVAAVLTMFPGGAATPRRVLKVPLTRAAIAPRRREAWLLGRLAWQATQSGVAVPEAATTQLADGRWLLSSPVMPGAAVAPRLAASPAGAVAMLDAVAQWLERWSRATRRPGTASLQRLSREILRPAAELGDAIHDGPRYLAWLEAACRRCEGVPLPVVATHNDLTMMNVVSAGGSLGVLDWEAAREDGLPLTDYFNAAADIHAAAAGYRDKAARFRDAMNPLSPFGIRVNGIALRLCDAIGCSRDLLELLRHAWVLPHAVDEHRRGRRDGPYIHLARWLSESARGAVAR